MRTSILPLIAIVSVESNCPHFATTMGLP